jgi:hypothetical protein
MNKCLAALAVVIRAATSDISMATAAAATGQSDIPRLAAPDDPTNHSSFVSTDSHTCARGSHVAHGTCVNLRGMLTYGDTGS